MPGDKSRPADAHMKVTPIEDPLPRSSFGSIGRFVNVEAGDSGLGFDPPVGKLPEVQILERLPSFGRVRDGIETPPKPPRVLAWGLNNAGQIGDGTLTNRTLPVVVGGLSDVIGISAGLLHSLALKSDGTAWAWGSNMTGEAGYIPPASVPFWEPSPIQVGGLVGVKAIASGHFHNLAVVGSGTVWTWGRDVIPPAQVVGLTDVTAVSAGEFHSLALTASGRIWSWGRNNRGALGDGTAIDRVAPVQVNLPGAAIAVACGANHSLALRSDGSVWTWGANSWGNLGIGTADTNNHPVPVQIPGLADVKAIAAGNHHCMALTAAGFLWAWGGTSQDSWEMERLPSGSARSV